ncbi:MAG TPA: hypothetical protein VFX02_01600 [Gammaproteobacteria bacterium]|nr:hypothetical protein [Gammaproteobacteria bacterium]
MNKNLSEDPAPLIEHAVASLRKKRRQIIVGDSGRDPETGQPLKVVEGPAMPGESDPYGHAAASDPRLAALWADSVAIEQNAAEMRFAFDGAATVSYSIGQATSTDQNINLAFSDWEGSQFVVEKNGPEGQVLERWILSPDASQLYLTVSVEIMLPDFPVPSKPLLIGRMFDKVVPQSSLQAAP